MARINSKHDAADTVNLLLSASPAALKARASSHDLNHSTKHTAVGSASHALPPAVPAVALDQAGVLIYPEGGVWSQPEGACAADVTTATAPTQSIPTTPLVAGLPITSGEEPRLPLTSTDGGNPGGRVDVDTGIRYAAEQTPAPLGKIDLYPPRDPLTYTDFDKKYPPDRHGEEAQPNARVWRVYRDRVKNLDDDLIQGWNSTLDVLLIFAGLFSAVATAFIIEAAKKLQHDYTEYTAIGVFAVLATLNSTVPPPASLPDFVRVPTTTRSRWINGLWFTSLTFALIDALIAILVKQWLVEYASRMRQPAADAKRWAWRHFAFREGLSKWHVGLIISSLAVLLHVALFLFLFGLLAFLFDLDHSICAACAIFTGFTASFYLAATLAPLWYGDCPSITPLLTHARGVALWICDTARSIIPQTDYLNAYRSQRHLAAYHGNSVISGHECLWDAKVLSWMIENLANDIDVNLAVDAIGSQNIFAHQEEFGYILQDNSPLFRDSVGHAVERRLCSLLLVMNRKGTDTELASLALALRSCMFIHWSCTSDVVTRLAAHKRLHLFDLRILRPMMLSRHYSSDDGRTPDSSWVHDVTLSAVLSWKKSWGVDTETPVQPIQPLTLDLLLSDITSGMEATAKWKETIWFVLVIAAIAPVSQWTVPQLKTLAQIARKTLELRFRPAFNSSDRSLDEKNLRSEWESVSLDIVDLWYFSGLMAFGFAIKHAEQLAISTNTVESLASGFSLFLECASTQPPLTLQQAERCLCCIWSSVVASWDRDLISPSAAAKLLCKTNSGLPYWSAKLGQIVFEIARLLQSKGDTHHIAQLNEFLSLRLRSSLIGRVKQYQTAQEHITDGVLNLLLPRTLDATSSLSASAWAIMKQSRTPAEIIIPMIELARELALLAQLMTIDITYHSGDISCADLFHELAGKDYGIKLAVLSTRHFAEFARHGRVASDDWWQQAKQRVLALSEDEWSAREPKWEYSTPQQLVDAIDTAKHCCLICENSLPLIIVARAAEVSTTPGPKATPVDQDPPAPRPAAHSSTREPINIAQRTKLLLARVSRWIQDASFQETNGEDAEVQNIYETEPAAV